MPQIIITERLEVIGEIKLSLTWLEMLAVEDAMIGSTINLFKLKKSRLRRALSH